MPSYDPNSDAWLDAELRNVPLPDGLLDRLRQVPGMTDEELDQSLCDVPLPAGMLRRLERVADPAVRRYYLQRLALAASLLLAMWLIYTATMAGFLVALTEPPQPPPPVPVPKRIVDARLAKSLPAPEPTVRKFEQPVGDAPAERHDKWATFDPTRPIPGSQTPEKPPKPDSPIDQLRQLFGTVGGEPRADLLSDVNLARWKDIPASHAGFDSLPEVQRVAGWTPQGVVPPRVAGYNIAVLTRWGIHPFVAPGWETSLQSSDVPLGVTPASYEMTRRCVEDGQLPPAEAIRTEEFLAAIACNFPKPTSQPLGLSAFGGPTPFRYDGRQLLQIGVQAQELDLKHSPVRLTLALDISESMKWEGRLDSARKAVERIVPCLSPADRISLVVFSEEARVLCEDVASADRQLLFAALRSLRPQNATNFGAGLGLAYSIARRPAKTAVSNHLVLITDGLAELERSPLYSMEERIREAAAAGVRLHVVHLAQKPTAEADSPWERFVLAGEGKRFSAASADEVFWALRETVTGKPQLVARDARLRVMFNPKSVAAYRLVGHEARLLAGLNPAPLETDFHAGQSSSAVYEVVLIPGGEAEVARAELNWKAMDKSLSSTISLVVRRQQFASLWTKAPRSIQAAGIVAEAAEVFRGSPEVFVLPPFVRPRPSSGLAHVIHIAGETDTGMRNEPSFADFVATLKKAEAIRVEKAGGRK